MTNVILITALCAAVLCAAAYLCALFVTVRKNAGTKIIYGAVNSDADTAYILLSADTNIPLYVSDGVTALFGLEKSSVAADICALEWCVDSSEVRRISAEYEKRDLSEPFTAEFEFENIDTKQKHFGRLYIAEQKGGYRFIRIDEISDEIKIRSELREEMERVKTEEQQKSDFLSKMSHEIRTPMNGIIGMIKMARDNISNRDEAEGYLSKADNLSQFLLSLINDILDMSKLESGKVELEHIRFDLLDVYEKINHMFRSQFDSKNIDLIMKHEDLDTRYVIGDSMRLLQVLINFISNAYKYTDRGSVTINFRQMNKTDGKLYMMFSIRDTGKGMDPEFLSRIFKPFEQESASTTRKFGGTGLGMAIADSLVTLMGGHIVVDTAIGKGSDFSVFIPFDIAEGAQDMNLAPASLRTEKREVSLDGLRIIMAEDNDINAMITVDLLESEGASVDRAVNGREAIDLLTSHDAGYYDLILMDIQMPELNGWDAAQAIRRLDGNYSAIPIIALSANAYVEDKRQSIKVGMNGHISKPIDFDELKNTLGEIM